VGLAACGGDSDVGFRSGSPLDDLPEWIRPLLPSGLRPDWSPDGRRLVYLDALVGDVHELDLASGESRGRGGYRRLTHFSEYAGFGANNPVISPDGRSMAFGLRIKGGGHGNAQGILLFDLERFAREP
jgi:hypothetical protein